ncbi:response regulator [Marinisporobacter balticus]|uniref:Stage 0 sporulation protein A homolog n=1 Tax=Marinisporobacter balticus TaxID=2018667 RepID=A0A4R2KQE6_9FIRM|nr:response regulator [Marinisporobacter balticus]TCO73139.1 two-component system chemotaxis response regulator CheY [Marinisporobacter balticus]
MKRIMVVDDAAFMRMSLKMMLEKNGYQVVGEAENGKVAVQKAKKLNPDIITMDITMPEMDGITALKTLKEVGCKSKIIIISALGQESHVREAMILGANNFIVKPYKEPHVMEILSKL